MTASLFSILEHPLSKNVFDVRAKPVKKKEIKKNQKVLYLEVKNEIYGTKKEGVRSIG